MAFKTYGSMDRLEGIAASVIHFMNGNSIKEEPKGNTEMNAGYDMPSVNPTENKDDTIFARTKKTNDMKNFTCRYCSKCFSQNYHLTRHERIHTGERPYPCSWCQKRFQRNEHLTRHIRIHTGEKPYSCSHCNKEFRRNDHLGKHIRTHTNTMAVERKNDEFMFT